MKKIIPIVSLFFVLGLVLYFVIGGYHVPKSDYVFSGNYEYLGATNEKQYFTTGYGTIKIFEFDDNKEELIYEGKAQYVKLLENQIIIFQEGQSVIGGFTLEKMLSMDLFTKELTEITFDQSIDDSRYKKGYQEVVGEDASYIYYSVITTELDPLESVFNVETYLHVVSKEEHMVIDRVLIDNSKDVIPGYITFFTKDNDLGYMYVSDGEYITKLINKEELSSTEIYRGDIIYISEWDNETCAIVKNDLQLFKCRIIDTDNIDKVKTIYQNYGSLNSFFIMDDQHITHIFSSWIKTFNYAGEMIYEVTFDDSNNNAGSYNGSVLYIDKEVQDYYFVRARIRLVEYDPNTQTESKSKRIDYDPEYIEFDGGV